MEKLKFHKYCGAGNDFVLIDLAENDVEITSELVIDLCNRRFGVGADGVLVIGDDDVHNFTMRYFNNDGSEGTLCGNGSRCSLHYADYSGRMKNNKAVFVNKGIKYSGEKTGEDYIKFYLNEPEGVNTDVGFTAEELTFKAMFADTGSAHVVINIEDVFNAAGEKVFKSIDDVDVKNLGRKIRNHEMFGAKGTNVNFIEFINGKLKIRTYERGVEDETLACGTGSTAAGILCYLKYGTATPVKLTTRGGDELIIDFNYSEGKFKNLSLSGPAVRVFYGEKN